MIADPVLMQNHKAEWYDEINSARGAGRFDIIPFRQGRVSERFPDPGTPAYRRPAGTIKAAERRTIGPSLPSSL